MSEHLDKTYVLIHHIFCPTRTVHSNDDCLCFELGISYEDGEAEAWLAAHDAEVYKSALAELTSGDGWMTARAVREYEDSIRDDEREKERKRDSELRSSILHVAAELARNQGIAEGAKPYIEDRVARFLRDYAVALRAALDEHTAAASGEGANHRRSIRGDNEAFCFGCGQAWPCAASHGEEL